MVTSGREPLGVLAGRAPFADWAPGGSVINPPPMGFRLQEWTRMSSWKNAILPAAGVGWGSLLPRGGAFLPYHELRPPSRITISPAPPPHRGRQVEPDDGQVEKSQVVHRNKMGLNAAILRRGRG